MNVLSTALLDPATRPQVVDTLTQLAESQVSAMRGISGTMMKTAFTAARKASPGSVRNAIDTVLPGVAEALDPYYAAKGEQAFGSYLSDPSRSGQVADELLAVADRKASAVEGNPLGKVYGSFRGKAKDHLVGGLPALGAALERFVR